MIKAIQVHWTASNLLGSFSLHLPCLCLSPPRRPVLLSSFLLSPRLPRSSLSFSKTFECPSAERCIGPAMGQNKVFYTRALPRWILDGGCRRNALNSCTCACSDSPTIMLSDVRLCFKTLHGVSVYIYLLTYTCTPSHEDMKHEPGASVPLDSCPELHHHTSVVIRVESKANTKRQTNKQKNSITSSSPHPLCNLKHL